MRADRLLSILLLLKTRGRMTARELATQMEVSERTIYRDMDSLNAAGIPIYADRGPSGGWTLAPEYRNNLALLTEDEVRTLFIAVATDPLADLGMGKALDGALLKLSAAIPAMHRQQATQARQRIHLDAAGWSHFEDVSPFLPTIQNALWNNRRLRLSYRRGDGARSERVVDPYGLVAKANIWYLVGATEHGLRVFRVARILNLALLDETFVYPVDFDLPAYWAANCAQFEASLSAYPVTLRVAPDVVPFLAQFLGERIYTLAEQTDTTDAEGWVTLPLVFDSADAARSFALNAGASVEILEPQELREQVVTQAAHIVAFYEHTISASRR